jgi:hypothetical protein
MQNDNRWKVWSLLAISFLILFTWWNIAFGSELKIIRQYDVTTNVEVKIPTGTVETCHQYDHTDNQRIKNGIIGGIIGNGIDGVGAAVGALVGVLLTDNKMTSACFEEKSYRTEVKPMYQYTVLILSDGVREYEQRIIRE